MRNQSKLNLEISIGNLLTAATIIISLISVLISWNADRNLKHSDRVIEVREAAAITLANLDRWKDISNSTFTQLQDAIVNAGQLVTKGKPEERQNNIILARDFLWKEISEIQFNNHEKILSEKIDIGYVQLLKYFPKSYNLYNKSLAQLRAEEVKMIKILLQATEKDIVAIERMSSPIQSADVGNKLRKTTDAIADNYSSTLDLATKQVDVFLKDILNSTNGKLADITELSKL